MTPSMDTRTLEEKLRAMARQVRESPYEAAIAARILTRRQLPDALGTRAVAAPPRHAGSDGKFYTSEPPTGWSEDMPTRPRQSVIPLRSRKVTCAEGCHVRWVPE